MSKNYCCTENGKWHCNIWQCIGWGVLGVLGFALILLIAGWVIMALWNHLIPGIFNLPAIGYWQALGLAVLFRLLFGGCGHGIHKWRRHHGYRSHCGCGCKCCGSESEKECCTHKAGEKEGAEKIEDPQI